MSKSKKIKAHLDAILDYSLSRQNPTIDKPYDVLFLASLPWATPFDIRCKSLEPFTESSWRSVVRTPIRRGMILVHKAGVKGVPTKYRRSASLDVCPEELEKFGLSNKVSTAKYAELREIARSNNGQWVGWPSLCLLFYYSGAADMPTNERINWAAQAYRLKRLGLIDIDDSHRAELTEKGELIIEAYSFIIK